MPHIHRTRSEPVDTSSVSEAWDLLSGNQVSNVVNETQQYNSAIIDKDVDSRDWKSMLRAGTNATTPLTVVRSVVRYKPGGGEAVNRNFAILEIDDELGHFVYNARDTYIGGTRRSYSGGLCSIGGPTATLADLDAADNRALIDFYKRARAAQTLEQGGTFIGEIRQTIDGFRHPCGAIGKFLSAHIRSLSKKRTAIRSAIRSGQFDAAKKIAGTRHIHSVDQAVGSMVSNSWLEMQYNWLPLVGDVVSSAKALADLNTRTSSSKRITGIGKDETIAPEQYYTTTAYPPFTSHYMRGQKVKYDVRYYGAVRVHLPDTGNALDDFKAASERFGLNVSNFIPTLYNIIPYSFVADYFSNLGDVVDALSFPTADIIWASKVYSQKTTDYVRGLDSSLPASSVSSDFSGSLNLGSTEVDSETLTRSVADLDYHKIPSLELKVPGAGSKQWLNLSALAAQLFHYRHN